MFGSRGSSAAQLQGLQPAGPFSMNDDDPRSGAARYDDPLFQDAASSRPLTGGTRLGTAGVGSSTRLGTSASRLPTASGRLATSGPTGYNVIVLTENRAREVGAAIVNLGALHTIELVQLVDSPSYASTQALLQAVAPIEIVLPKSQADRMLFKKVRKWQLT